VVLKPGDEEGVQLREMGKVAAILRYEIQQ